MDGVLAGQRAVVTGASSGIGAAIAVALAAAGARVVVNYRSGAERAAAVVERIRRDGGEAVAVQADIAREADVERLIAAAVDFAGGLDILVANAGIQRDAPSLDMSLAEWQTVIDVNLTGQFLCARAAARRFVAPGTGRRERGARGKIVFVSSVHQRIPWAGHSNYAASKGGLDLLMRSLAQELAAAGIRVNAVAPGAIRTAINEAAWSDPAARRDLLKLIPYGRIGEAEDVARAVVWLASDLSDYVVGSTLFIDGGMSLYPGFREAG